MEGSPKGEPSLCIGANAMGNTAMTTGVAEDQLTMLFSLVGDVHICQVVDPEKTVRFEMAKYVIEQL